MEEKGIISDLWLRTKIISRRWNFFLTKKAHPNKNLLINLFIFFVFLFFRAAPAAYGAFQARGLIGAVAASLHHSHRSTGCEPHL